ncbi:DUF5937 family protein [Streptomyces sp. NPDC059063]|uniref:ArsR/SmtB family transcription factor n=1 Tax=unclassified Streptomyces TaxID=2593676 RepID=UPI0036AE62D0
MAVHIPLSGAEVARVRFAISPLGETTLALRALLREGAHAVHRPWLRMARPLVDDVLEQPTVAHVLSRCLPSFLFPVPGTREPSFEDEIALLRSTDTDFARAELAAALGDSTPLGADPVGTLNVLADTLERFHTRVVAPHWGRVRAVLNADVDARARTLTGTGVEGLFQELHQDIAWREGELVVHGGRRPGSPYRVDVAGHGLVLMPSAFAWPDVYADTAPVTAGSVRYPARGVGLLWERPAPVPDGLAAVIGRTRAALLGLLAEPLTTAQLAVRAGVTPSAVSQHLGALRAAGLVATRRHGRSAIHLRTERAAQLTCY